MVADSEHLNFITVDCLRCGRGFRTSNFYFVDCFRRSSDLEHLILIRLSYCIIHVFHFGFSFSAYFASFGENENSAMFLHAHFKLRMFRWNFLSMQAHSVGEFRI